MDGLVVCLSVIVCFIVVWLLCVCLGSLKDDGLAVNVFNMLEKRSILTCKVIAVCLKRTTLRQAM